MDIRQQIKSSWDKICLKVNKSVVFVDDACAQSLHWNGGAMLLFSAGAVNVKEFSSFECGSPRELKAVFLLSGPLMDLKLEVLRDILQASSFQYVLLITSLCSAMHGQIKHGNPESGQQFFHELEDQMLEWMSNMNYTVEVFSLPLMCAPITNNMFIFPEHEELFPLLPHEKNILKEKLQRDYQSSDKFELVYTHLPAEAQLRMKLLVCSLNSLLEQLSVNEDCYCMGDTSRIVATELAALSWAKARRKSAENRGSLLLIDRTLDLASATGHHYETLLDKIMAVLPRFPGHSSDVLVNMNSLLAVPSMCSSNVIAAGCLAHPGDAQASALLNTLTTAKQKESLMEVNRQLVESAASRNLPIKLSGKPGRVTSESLQNTIQLFKGDKTGLRQHCGVLQIGQSVAQCLQHDGASRLDALLAVEKGLLQSLHDQHTESPLTQIAATINREIDKPAEKRTYTMEDLFCLLVYIYTLLDPHDLEADDEATLKAALEGALMNEELDKLPSFLQELIGSEKTEEQVFHALDDIFKKLESLLSTRDGLKQFKFLIEGGGMTSAATLRPLFKHVMEEIFNSQRELSDVEYKSTGFRDLLKSGFGLFMNVSKPRPNDHKLLMIFVIGGITSTEVRQIKEVVSSAKSDTQVVVGSTRMIGKENLLHQIFVSDHVH